jgi:hypothetical protein
MLTFIIGYASAVTYLGPSDVPSEALESASDVPFAQIQASTFGSLVAAGSDGARIFGEVYAALPTHATVPITESIAGSGFGENFVGAVPYPLVSQCVATTPANQARTTIGVGEQVTLTFGPGQSVFIPINATWTTTAGGVYPTTGQYTTFTAPSNAPPGGMTATVTATFAGKSFGVTYTVVPPSGVDHAIIISINNIQGVPTLSSGQAGAQMYLNVYFAPTNVSFYRVAIMEVGEDATNISGYFSQWTPYQLGHATADHWTQLNQANVLGDTCADGPHSTWIPGGGYTWNIPAGWQVIGSAVTNSLNGWNQVFSLASSGTEMITKHNRWVQRATNNIITTQ